LETIQLRRHSGGTHNADQRPSGKTLKERIVIEF
jgi:hypothetical protein